MSFTVTIIVLGVLIALHELGHMVVARNLGMTVLRYSIGFFYAIFSWRSKRSGVIYQVGVLPLGGFVQIKGMNPFEKGAAEDADSYQNKPVWRRALVIVAGPFANLFLAWALFFGLYATTGVPRYVNKAAVGAVAAERPAAEAGLMTGDVIETLNGEPLTTWKDLVSRLEANPGKALSLEVKRGEERLWVMVTPENRGSVGKIGIGPPTVEELVPLHLAALGAAERCIELVGSSLSALGRLITGKSEDGEVGGVVKVVQQAAHAFDTGMREFLAFMAYISLMLFLFNLLPMPALDGGRAMFLLYEAVTRRRVHPKVDVWVNTVGFFLLIGLLILTVVKDVWKF